MTNQAEQRVPAPPRVRWCEDTACLGTLREEWNSLLRQSESDTVFLTWEWVSCWWRHFGTGQELWILELREEDGTLSGIAPLKRRVRRTRGGTIRYIEFLGAGGAALPDHLGFIFVRGEEQRCLAAVMKALEERSSEWDLLYLTDTDRHSSTGKALECWLASQHRWAHRFRNTVCPYLPLPRTWAELEGNLRGGLRKDLRYIIRRAAKRGATMVVRESPEELERGYRELARLHQLRMTNTERGGNFGNPVYAAFHRELMDVFVRLGWLELRFLEIEGNPIAVEYGFRYGGKVYGYQLGFDPAFSRLGPGTVLLGMRVQQLITEGYRELDMLRGSGAYKYHWTKVDRENHNYVIPRPGVRGLTSYTQDLLALPPALLLKRVAPVTAFEKMRDVWARVRGRKPPPRNPGHHTRTRSSKGTRAGQE